MLEVRNLTVSFPDETERIEAESVNKAVKGISFSMKRGEILAVIGESGSGKSMTALSIAGLLPETAASSGQIIFDGSDLMSLTKNERRIIQGAYDLSESGYEGWKAGGGGASSSHGSG